MWAFVVAFWGLEMRVTDPTESACLQTALEGSNKNVYDLGLKQRATSRQRRIRDLEHENTLLMRMVSETQIEIARLREQLFSK